MRQDSLSWDDIRIFRDKWPGILMIKGINRTDDAVKAIEYGVDGLIVSNHGGRNMDSAVASIDVLPEIAEAVGERNQKGKEGDYPPAEEGWDVEAALDEDMASAACPHCHILMVEGKGELPAELGARSTPPSSWARPRSATATPIRN